MALVKYLPIFKMAAIVKLYRQILTGVQAHADSMKLAETKIKIIKKPMFLGKSNLEAPTICVLRNLLEVHMYFNE